MQGLLRLVGVLALTALLGWAAVDAAPDATHALGVWPVGLVTGALLWAGPRQRPAVALVALVVAVGSVWGAGRPLGLAIGLGLVVVAQAAAGAWYLLRNPDGPRLVTGAEGIRFARAGLLSLGVVAVGGAIVPLVTGVGTVPSMVLGLLGVTFASHLALVPYFLQVSHHAPLFMTWERVLHWVIVAAVCVIIFWIAESLPLLFVLIPFLVVAAARGTVREVQGQVLMCGLFAAWFTTAGHGPFPGVHDSFGHPAWVEQLMLVLFIGACAIGTLPFAMTTGLERGRTRAVAIERDLVQRIVRNVSGIAIIGLDEDARITLFNPGAEELLGYRESEVLGELPSFFHERDEFLEHAQMLDVEPSYPALASALTTAPRGPCREWTFRRKDGEVRRHSMTLTRVYDERNGPAGYVVTSEDVTERMARQQALEEALAAQRLAMARLRELDRIKDGFVANVSHELRTPITNIVGYLELLEDGAFGELGKGQAKAMARVSQNSTRLLELIEDLLLLVRAQEDLGEHLHEMVDARDVVASARAKLARALEGRELNIEVRLTDEPLVVRGDREKLERVMLNLASNAVKFTPDGGRIKIRAEQLVDAVELSVSDTGLGIPPDEQGLLFTRFFRSSIAEEHAIQGSGLGLSIAATIVELHGGTIEVTSAPGEGSTFRVVLPQASPVRRTA
ncbi:ATP-binding protein [Nocardioides pacificus]